MARVRDKSAFCRLLYNTSYDSRLLVVCLCFFATTVSLNTNPHPTVYLRSPLSPWRQRLYQRRKTGDARAMVTRFDACDGLIVASTS